MAGGTPKQSPIAMLVEAKKENSRRANMPLTCEACGSARGPDDAFFELTMEAKNKFTSNGAAVNGAGNATSMTTANGKTDNDGREVTVAGFALRPGSGICEACYIRGAFPEGYDTSDFTLMPTVTQNTSAGDKWTEEETNAMLEAVSSTRSNKIKGTQGVMEEEEELSGSCDWNYIAAKVGTKTADECLLHFLEMPLLNQTERKNAGSGVFGAIQSLQPFSAGEALNVPVLDLASLVEQVDPLVAKAAAHAAIGAIKRLHTMPVVGTSRESSEAVDAAKGVSMTAVKVEGTPSSMDQSSFQGAVTAVAESVEAAGIASTVKTEDASADDDVAMEDMSSLTTATAASGDSASKMQESDTSKSDSASITKEMMAVTEEAANATTVALVAARAQKIADDTATGPVRDLVNQLLENQLRQMELKMQQLSVLEQTIIAEKDQLAKEKYQLYVDRLSFAQGKDDQVVLDALVNSVFDAKSLELRNFHLDKLNIQQLGTLIGGCRHEFQNLSMEKCTLSGDKFFTKVTEGLTLNRVKLAHFRVKRCQQLSMTSLIAMSALFTSALVTLEISSCKLPRQAGIILSQSLQACTSLRHLLLADNNIRDGGLRAIADALKLLHVSSGSAVATTLGQEDDAPSAMLEQLDISRNGITSAGFASLMQLPLRCLSASGNSIESGVGALLLSNSTTLEMLCLVGNPLSEDGKLDLVRSLFRRRDKTGKSALRELDLRACGFDTIDTLEPLMKIQEAESTTKAANP
ncbi:hypothetical protein BBO99_00001329 [Phytophthora kernoviae]|uniref:SANT domain-containing protein n=1 Tax=Phytophthora kernoviae TaxID=325452 RepID=A0A3R7GJN0_9STRA|nr:hypothetical protein BBI17_001182 [Phytophthora kernoviae]RLN84403.1 hypothetical protein BBO99_00001329 [Phytophthora kernoviae]